MTRFIALLLGCILSFAAPQRSTIDWKAVDDETLRHFQALTKIDTSDPPGQEKPAVDYLNQVLESEEIPVQVLSYDPNRPDLVARLRFVMFRYELVESIAARQGRH